MRTLRKVYPTEQTGKAIGREFDEFVLSDEKFKNEDIGFDSLDKLFENLRDGHENLLSGFAQHVLKLEDNTEELKKWEKKKERIDAEKEKKLDVKHLEVRTKDGTLIFVGVR